MPELAKQCIASWHRFLPDYVFKCWNEDNFDINSHPYVKEAYEVGKFAFVSDYVRLYALYTEGGIYMDTDVEVLKPYDDLLGLNGFIGFEGTKHLSVGTGTIASRPEGDWVKEQIKAYEGIHFQKEDGSFDLTTNPVRITAIMCKGGLHQNGLQQDYLDMRVFPVEYFCPRQTTGEIIMTENTYCDHHFMGSWNEKKRSNIYFRLLGQKNTTHLIKLKRKLLG